MDNSASFVDDLGADELDTVELVLAYEAEFNCGIPDQAMQKLFTINDMVDYIATNCFSLVGRTPGGKSEALETPRFYVNLTSVQFIDNDIGWAVGELGAVFHTTDGGTIWSEQRVDVYGDALRSVYFHTVGERGWVVGDQGTMLNTTNGGASWVPPKEKTDDWFDSVQFLSDARRCWAVGETGVILATTDGGENWVRQKSETDSSLVAVQFFPDGQRGWAVGLNGTILVTINGGNRWQPQSSGTENALYSVNFLDASRGWAVGLGGTILTTTDGGDTWQSQSSETEVILKSVDFRDPQTGWIVGENGTVLATSNGGITWAPRSRDLAGMLADGSGWRISGTGSVEFTADGGETWQTEDNLTYTRFPAPWYYFSLLLVVGLIAPLARDTVLGLLSDEDREETTRTSQEGSADPSPSNLNLEGRFASDRPLEAGDPDPLGFGTIAGTIALFLRHEKTEPPLTVAITGEWGSGKSSLMNLLRANLIGTGWRPVWFNAWHHQKEEHLLASLLDIIRRGAVPHWWQPSGLWVRSKLVFIRLWRRRTLVLPLAVLFAPGSLTYALNPGIAEHQTIKDFNQLLSNLKPAIEHSLPQTTEFFAELLEDIELLAAVVEILPGILAVSFLWWLARNRLTSGAFSPARLLAAIAGRAKSNALGAQLQFRHRFAEEFRDMALALSRPRPLSSPLVVFIDDLDRCRPQNVLDVLEAVNFLVTSGICFVVVGMDRDRVEACIGLGFKDVAKELAVEPEPVETSPNENKVTEAERNEPAPPHNQEKPDSEHEERRQRRAYARDYLEKLVNIEVPVPELGGDRASRLLDNEDEGTTTQARLILKAATLTERFAVPTVLFLALLAFGIILMPSQAPVSSNPPKAESPTPSGATPDSGGTGESRGADRTNEFVIDDTGQTRFIDGQLAKSSDTALIRSFVPIVLILVVLTWVGRQRMRADRVEDSETFNNELGIWRPVILARRNTPRAIKRYLNRVRYLAMRLRPESPVENGGGPLVNLVHAKFPDLQNQSEISTHGHILSEAMLVAMSAIEYCDRDWLEKDELFKKVHSGLAHDLKKDLPDGVNEDVVDKLVTCLEAHIDNSLNQWPPSPEQRNAFSDIAAGVRFAEENTKTS